MGSVARRFASFRPTLQFRNSVFVSVAAGLIVSVMPLRAQVQAYDGPTFPKGLWLFQRSTELVTQHVLMPSVRRVQIAAPVLRCVNPTEAMIETFRPVSIGGCHSTAPEKIKNTFVFAKRCDYSGPVKTVISVNSETSYVETNESIVGKSPKKETVVARRISDCGNVPDMGSADASAYSLAAAEASAGSEGAGASGDVADAFGDVAVSSQAKRAPPLSAISKPRSP
jgi:hypothetical protein